MWQGLQARGRGSQGSRVSWWLKEGGQWEGPGTVSGLHGIGPGGPGHSQLTSGLSAASRSASLMSDTFKKRTPSLSKRKKKKKKNPTTWV